MKKTLFPLLLPLGLLAAGSLAFTQSATLTALTSKAQTRTLSGRVTDKQGQGLPGVTVKLKNTNVGTSTDATGHYQLASVPLQATRVQFSAVGYITQEVAAPANLLTLNVVLQADNKALSEVVVIDLNGQPARMATSQAARKPQRRTVAVLDQEVLRDKSISYPAPPPALAYPTRTEAGAADNYAKVQENAFPAVSQEPMTTF